MVVVAAGIRSAQLVEDEAPRPSRGQVALLANPGLERWLVDDDHPDGMVYALPHPGWVVCGGTDVMGSWDLEPDAEVLGLPDYWTQVLRMFEVHRRVRHQEPVGEELLGQLLPIYRQFVKERWPRSVSGAIPVGS